MSKRDRILTIVVPAMLAALVMATVLAFVLRPRFDRIGRSLEGIEAQVSEVEEQIGQMESLVEEREDSASSPDPEPPWERTPRYFPPPTDPYRLIPVLIRGIVCTVGHQGEPEVCYPVNRYFLVRVPR